jgi:hypothetical protein
LLSLWKCFEIALNSHSNCLAIVLQSLCAYFFSTIRTVFSPYTPFFLTHNSCYISGGGYYATGGNQYRCVAGSGCPRNSTAITYCADGFYQPDPLQPSCLIVNPGQIPVNRTNAAPGKLGARGVELCPPGYFCLSGSLVFPCSKGSFCPGGSIVSTPCPIGTYQDQSLAINCTDVPIGISKFWVKFSNPNYRFLRYHFAIALQFIRNCCEIAAESLRNRCISVTE